jgi:hypothetical protein
MLVTLLGMVTLARLVQPIKVASQMLVTLLGMVKVPFLPPGYDIKVVLFLLYKIPLSEEYALLLLSVFIALRLSQKPKAPLPMLVTLSGMVTLARLAQKAKAPSPMLVTLFGMITLARLVQELKA